MNIVYMASTMIRAERDDILAVLGRGDFANLYFPEVRKHSPSVSAAPSSQEQQHLPSYIVPCHGIGWSTSAGNTIRIPNKSIQADITDIDIEFQRLNNGAKISIEVSFEAHLDLKSAVAAYYVRKMVKSKLKALKRDIEANRGLERGHTFLRCEMEY